MPSPDDMIDVTVRHINRMIRAYGIELHEWPLMEAESPEVWRVIQQIEWLGPQSIETTQRNCNRLILNYTRLFIHRLSRRIKHAG